MSTSRSLRLPNISSCVSARYRRPTMTRGTIVDAIPTSPGTRSIVPAMTKLANPTVIVSPTRALSATSTEWSTSAAWRWWIAAAWFAGAVSTAP